MLNRLFVTTLILLFNSHSYSQHKSVLFIGNSYTGVNNLPELVYQLALANGDDLVYDSNTPGGYHFQLHKDNVTTLSKIAAREWDFVILQQQSQLPALPPELAGEAYSPPHAEDLNELIKANDTCTKVIFYMTWGRKTGDASYCPDHPPVCTYDGMQNELKNGYLEMAVANNAAVAPAGMAWKAVIDDDPTIELYSGDGSHPNINGSYLTACVMYASIFQKSPIGISFISTLDAELAAYLQEKAHETVFNDLETWRIGLNDLTADFSFSAAGLNFSFENSSMEATAWEWDIDGIIYTEENPSHTFITEGTYEVTLTTFNACDTVALTQTINTVSASIIDFDNTPFSFDPNPVTEWLYFSNIEGIKEVLLFNIYGQVIMTIDPNQTANLSELSNGTYFLRVGNETHKLIKI